MRFAKTPSARAVVRATAWIVGALVAWQLVAAVYHSAFPESADSRMPMPTGIGAALQDEPELFLDALGVTSAGAAVGLLVGVAIGVVIACTSVVSRIVESLVYPYLIASQMVPTIILAPIVLAVLQDGTTARVVVAAYLCFFVMALNLTKGLKSIPPDQLVLLRSVDARPWQFYTKLRLPSALPYFFAGLKIAAPLSVVGEVTVELTGAQSGLGTLTLTSLKYGNDQIYTFWASALLIGVLGYGLFLLAVFLERWATPWQAEFRSSS